MTGPLLEIDRWLPRGVKVLVDRETPIPSLAEAAARAKAAHPDLVRSDIGQVVGVDPEREVLYGPPVGLPETRAAVAQLYEVSLGVNASVVPGGLSVDHVCVTTGAAEALSAILRCVAAGRTVALPVGHWSNYDNGVALAGGEVADVRLFAEDGTFEAEGLARQLDDTGAEVLVVNFPCNPTGAVLTQEERRQLAQVVKSRSTVVIADEVYAHLRYDDEPTESLLALAPDHVLSVGSASKQYLLPGARVGWVVSAHRRITDHILRRVVRASSASPNVLGQRRLLEVLVPDLDQLRAGEAPRHLSRVREAMRGRRDTLLAVLAEAGFDTDATRPPEGTIFMVVGLPDWWTGSDASFCEKAIAGGYFSCIPGSAFGLDGTVRFSFGATSLDDLGRLAARIASFRAALDA